MKAIIKHCNELIIIIMLLLNIIIIVNTAKVKWGIIIDKNVITLSKQPKIIVFSAVLALTRM